MKTYFALLTAIGMLLACGDANGQPCQDTATVLPNGSVFVKWCCPTIPVINIYGMSLQRRNEQEPIFRELDHSFCQCLATDSCTFLDTTVTAGVWYYRVKEIDLDGTVTFREPLRVGVTVTSVQDVRPEVFALQQNFPNPFNPTTKIAFELSRRSFVTLKVYDLLGQEVALLSDGIHELGRHETSFSTANLPTGIYFYRLSADGFVQTRKMALQK